MSYKFKEALKIYTQEELENYYIKELHSFRETCEHFNVYQGVLTKLFNFYNIKKTQEQITQTNQRNKNLLKNTFNLKSLKEDYFSRNYRQQELANKYNLTKTQLRMFIYKNGWNKQIKDPYFSRYTLDEIINIIDNSKNKKEILHNLEIRDREKYANELNISYETLNKVLDYYHIENISKKLGYEKATKTKIDRYGSGNNIEKIKQTNLKKYGCEYSSQREDCKKKARKTKLERYGSETYNNRSQFLATMNEKYGGWGPVVEKVQATNLERYGEKYFSSTKIFKEKVSKNNAIKNLKNMIYSDEFISLRTSYIKSKKFFEDNYKKFSCFDLSKKFSVKLSSIYSWIETFKLNSFVKVEVSKYEKEITQWLKELEVKNIRLHCRNLLDNLKEIDIYLSDYHIGIEFNGDYWHSDINIKDTNYHLNKSCECFEKGIILFHIFESEWNNNKQEIKKQLSKLINFALGSNLKEIQQKLTYVKNIISTNYMELPDKTNINKYDISKCNFVYLPIESLNKLKFMPPLAHKITINKQESIIYDCGWLV